MLTIKRGKVVNRRDANPCKERNAKGKNGDRSMVQIPVPAKDFFSEISGKFRYNHFAEEMDHV